MPGWPRLAGGTRLPRLRHVFVHAAGGSARPGMRTVADLAESGSGRPAEDTGFADPHFRSDVIYTSGTTGRPKGVMISHDMVLRTAYASAYTRAFEDGRRILFALPLYHVFGYIECLIACSFVGGAIIPRLIFTAEDTLGAAERHRASEMVCVPVMTLKLLELARSRGFDSTAFVAMFNSGGVSPPSIWNDIRTHLGAREVMTAYGMTETTASTACTLPEGADAHLLTSNGRLKDAGVAGEPELGGVLALYKAVDPQSGQDLPPGQMGELVARGPIITPGYYRNPAETAACIDADGWLHTGDLGWVSEDGFITLSGRRKETYRCGGEMVMPLEVEEVLNTHPLVAQAYAVGIPDARMGEIGCACIVPAGDRPTIESLLALCDSRLARFKVPRHIVFLTAEEVPMTATGRPQRVLLADIARRRLAVLS
jgi:fatty-acyl-CoA synthase